MPFGLQITFTGLGLFVPDPGGEAMHIVMPSTEGHGNGIEPHFARLYYDRAHEGEGEKRAAGDLVCVDLEHKALELVGVAGRLMRRLPPAIVNLDMFVEEPVAPARYGSHPGPSVISRATLRAGGVASYPKGGCFEMGSPRRIRITFIAIWRTKGIQQDHLDLALAGLNGSGGDPERRLYPIGEGNSRSIHLQVFNATEEDLPGSSSYAERPENGTPVPHFKVYYDLFREPKRKPIPEYYEAADELEMETWDDPAEDVQVAGDVFRPRPFGGRPFTCLLASATAASAQSTSPQGGAKSS